jgi:hypothetical protein
MVNCGISIAPEFTRWHKIARLFLSNQMPRAEINEIDDSSNPSLPSASRLAPKKGTCMSIKLRAFFVLALNAGILAATAQTNVIDVV